jgi:long-chain acyl-CoA synthetase
MANLVAVLARSVREHGARPLFGTRSQSGWSWLSYDEFARRVDALRGGLASLGVSRGDRVAVISRNRIEWAVGCYASTGLGATYVPMYEEQSEREWRHILADSGAKVCLLSGSVRERVAAAAAEVPSIHHLVDFDAVADAPTGYAALLEKGGRSPVTAISPEESDVAEIVYTSGTTGTPKGVLLTHGNIVANISAVISLLPVSAADRTLSFLPWAHVFGGDELHGLISLGASMGICSSVDRLASELGEVQPTLLFAVPRVWNRVYQAAQHALHDKPRILQRMVTRATAAMHQQRLGEPVAPIDRVALATTKALVFGKIRERFGGRLRFAVSAAAALAPEVAEFIDDLGVVVLEAYGLTETSACATINRPDERRIGTVGKPIPGVRIVLDHTVAGAEDDSGEIVVYGHCVMAGYHNLPEETARALTSDGGLRTGDLGRFDAEGFLHITGRLKELYKLENGKYVAPAVLEEQLTLSSFIEQAFVHGADRPFNVALIVPSRAALEEWARAHELGALAYDELLREPGVRALIEGEIAAASAQFKGFERIADFALVTEPFSVESGTLTPTLKIKRRRVLDRHRDRLEALYRERTAAAAPASPHVPGARL